MELREENQTGQVSTFSKIRSSFPQLAALESRVAEWILENPNKVVDLSMAQIGQSCGVSDTTVLRFCRSAGFYGFADLKINIIRDLARPTEMINEKIDERDDIPIIVRKVFTSNSEALRDTLEVMDYSAFSQALDLLAGANRIIVIGVGTSSPIVMEAYQKFFRIGLNCKAQTDSYLQLMEVSLLGSGDVVLGISQTGASADPIATLRLAKQNEVSTICITGNAQSPITQFADVTLLSVAHEKRAEATASRIAQSTIVDALYICLALRNVSTAISNERRAFDAVLPKTV